MCDRRMPERQTPSWGPHSKSSGQVNCVRRLGLPDEEWEGVSPRSQRRVFSGERHITCVKMSPDKADEVGQLLGCKPRQIPVALTLPGDLRVRKTLNIVVLPIRLPRGDLGKSQIAVSRRQRPSQVAAWSIKFRARPHPRTRTVPP